MEYRLAVPCNVLKEKYEEFISAEARFVQAHLSSGAPEEERTQSIQVFRQAGQVFEKLIEPATRTFENLSELKTHLDCLYPDELPENAKNVEHERDHIKKWAQNGLTGGKPACVYVSTDKGIHCMPQSCVDMTKMLEDPFKLARAIEASSHVNRQSGFDRIETEAFSLERSF